MYLLENKMYWSQFISSHVLAININTLAFTAWTAVDHIEYKNCNRVAFRICVEICMKMEYM
jgi:hypothetical protein